MKLSKRTSAANSLYWYSFYMMAMGAALLVYPEPLVKLLGLLSADPGWRVVGVLMAIVGLIAFHAGRTGQMIPLYRLSVYTRIGVFTVFTIMFIASLLNFVAVLIGLIELAGAMWTLYAIKKDSRSS